MHWINPDVVVCSLVTFVILVLINIVVLLFPVLFILFVVVFLAVNVRPLVPTLILLHYQQGWEIRQLASVAMTGIFLLLLAGWYIWILDILCTEIKILVSLLLKSHASCNLQDVVSFI